MSHRMERVSTQFKREISEIILRELRDPRLDEFVSVTEVNISPDLKFAKVYVSSIGGQEKQKIGIIAQYGRFFDFAPEHPAEQKPDRSKSGQYPADCANYDS